MIKNIFNYRDWGIGTKIIVPVILIIGSIVFFYIIPKVEDRIWTDKRQLTQNIIEIGYSIVSGYADRVHNGEFDVAEGQKRALQDLRNARFDGTNYIWVMDTQPVMIMHPAKPEMEGKNWYDYQDPNGKKFFIEMISVCKEKGNGFVEYVWTKPASTKPDPKISFVKLYAPWGWILGTGVYVDDVAKEINALILTSILMFIVVSIIAIIFGIYLSRLIGRPLGELTAGAEKLALGDVDVDIKAISKSKDEIGNLGCAFNSMVENIKHQAAMVEKIAKGDLSVDIRMCSDKDILAKSTTLVVNTLRSLIDESRLLTSAAVDGKLNVRGDVQKFQGGYWQIVDGFNSALNAIILPVKEGSDVLARMSAGDLTVRVTGDYSGDYQILKKSINSLGESLGSTIQRLAESVASTASASSEISASTKQMAVGAQEQTAQATEVVGAVEEMTKTIIENAQNANKALETAKKASHIAEVGGKVVRETVEGMNRIADVVKKSAVTVQALGKSSDQIGEIIQVIDDIADQTNLLALNAAIEAARAGDQGRGFAVVADEVRKLAERTTKATKEIAQMIKQIQNDTVGAVKSMEEGTREVDHGIELTQRAGSSLTEIVDVVSLLTDMATQIAAGSEQQSSTAEQISKNVEAISSVTQESAAGTQQIAQTAEDLNQLTESLNEIVGHFKAGDLGSNIQSNDDNQAKSNYVVSSNGKIVKHV